MYIFEHVHCVDGSWCTVYIQGIGTLAKIAHFYQIRSACNAIIHSMCNHLIRCLLQFGIQNQSLPHSFVSSVSTKYYNVGGADEKGFATISVPYFLSANPRGDLSSWTTPMDDDGGGVDDEWNNGLALDIRISFTIKAFFDLVKSYGVSWCKVTVFFKDLMFSSFWSLPF